MQAIMRQFQGLQKSFQVRFLSVVITLVALYGATTAGIAFAQRAQVDPPEPPAAETTITLADSPLLKGDEIFFRPDKVWGLRLNLGGFRNTSAAAGPSQERVIFATKEDDKGFFLAHVYVYNLKPHDSTGDAAQIGRKIVTALERDTAVVFTSVRASTFGDFHLVEYERMEKWETLIRRRYYRAITAYKDSWIDIRLSRTGYTSADQRVFQAVVNSLVIVDPNPNRQIHIPKPKKVTINKDTTKPTGGK